MEMKIPQVFITTCYRNKQIIKTSKRKSKALDYRPGVFALGVFPLLGVPGTFLGVAGGTVNFFSASSPPAPDPSAL